MKIPDQAKRVFKGVIFDVYQWEQEMFDGSKATFEMMKRPGTTQVIATVGDKIFMAHESQPTKPDFFSLPGGRLEEGEEPLAGAKRELLEESGLESDDWELYKMYEPVHKLDWQVHAYIARNCRKVAEPKLDSGEKIAIEAMDFDKFVATVLFSKFWGDTFVMDILRMKLDPEKLEEFRIKLFSV